MRSFCLLFLLSTVVLAKDDYSQIDPKVRQWFQNQHSPATGINCCSEADGVYAQEDIREGHYWTRFDAHGRDSGWMQVNDEVVIHDPNRNGAPVVWWWTDGYELKIRCYAPGSGL